MADQELKTKLGQWLSEQGYPLEFATAQAFAKYGFQVLQGYYVEEQHGESPREVDVIAEVNAQKGDA